MASRIDALCDAFEGRWRRRERPRIEEFLAQAPDQWKANAFCELAEIELSYRLRASERPRPGEYRDRFPEYTDLIDRLFRKAASARRMGAYELLEVIGRGGMGVVYLARHEMLDQTVALKVLPERCLADPQAVGRFQREMKLIGGLASPHIVRAYNAGEEQGQLYLAMEFVDGVTLQQLVKQFGAAPVGVAAEIIRQAAIGLQHAFAKGLVHRDIKPGNLMLSVEGEVKLLDLGLGRLRADLEATRQLSQHDLSVSGMAMGTVDYMAPEQWKDSSAVDIRADIYALGCTLFYLVTGKPPYGGDDYPTDRDKLHAHTTVPPPSLQEARPGVPEEFDWLLGRLLAKDPNERLDEPIELARFLAPFADAEATRRFAQAAADSKLLDRSKLLQGSDGTLPDRLRDTDVSPLGGSRKEAASGHTTITLPLSPRMAIFAAVVALAAVLGGLLFTLWPDPPHGRAGELAAAPGLNGGWWFDETPWLTPSLRVQLYRASASGERMLGGKVLPALLDRSRSGDVARLYDDLREVSAALRPRLKPREAEVVGLMWRIQPESRTEEGWLEELDGVAARLAAISDRSATENHLFAVLQHRRGRAHWKEAEAAYRAAIAAYTQEDAAPLLALCRMDFGQLLFAEKKLIESLGEFQQARKDFAAPTIEFASLVAEAESQRDRGGYLSQALERFTDAEKLSAIPEDHPLRSYLHEQRAWALLDAWRLKEAKESFEQARTQRDREARPESNERLPNRRALFYYLWTWQGEAMTDFFRGDFESARQSFSGLDQEIESGLGGKVVGAGYRLSQRQQSEYRQRRPNAYERWADCYLCGDLPSEGAVRQQYLEEAKTKLRSCVDKAVELGFERDARAPHVLRIRYKHSIAVAMADGPERARELFQAAQADEDAMIAAGVFTEPYRSVFFAAKTLAAGMIDILDTGDAEAVTRGTDTLKRALLTSEIADPDKVSRGNIDVILLGFETLADSGRLTDDPETLHRFARRFILMVGPARESAGGELDRYLSRYVNAVRDAVAQGRTADPGATSLEQDLAALDALLHRI